jgi:hypothetical protein
MYTPCTICTKGTYPQLFNQTACVRQEGNTSTPVYMHWLTRDGLSSENMSITNYVAESSFPAGTFTPPAPCPIDGGVNPWSVL